MVIPLFGISKVVISDLWISFLSSDATCVAIASFVLLYPSASATSLPTNHGSPEISTVLSSPNSGWLNTVGAVCESASERWGSILIPHHYVHFSKDVDSFYSLNVFPPPTKGMSTCDTSSFAMNGEWEILNFSHSKTLWNTADFIRVYSSEINLSFQLNTFPATQEKQILRL